MLISFRIFPAEFLEVSVVCKEVVDQADVHPFLINGGVSTLLDGYIYGVYDQETVVS